LFFSLLGGGVLVAAFFAYKMIGTSDVPAIDETGFDIASADEPKFRDDLLPSAYRKSSLGMVHKGDDEEEMAFGEDTEAGSKSDKEDAYEDFRREIRKLEAKGKALAIKFTKKYPVIEQYGEDWMSYPDLAQLNYDYNKHHDPVAFARGLARSRNFRKMVKKYAGKKEILSFVSASFKDGAVAIPALSHYLNAEGPKMRKSVDRLMDDIGLPAGILAGSSDKINTSRVMDSMMKANPGLDKYQ